MRKLIIAAVLLSAASVASIAVAQDKKPDDPMLGAVTSQQEATQAAPAIYAEASAPDARSIASDADVGQARRAYRAACNRYESTGFCECVTAGVAQALAPAEVRIAARTIGERINAQGDAGVTASSDSTPNGANSLSRIEQVEGHYADACSSLRGA